MATTWPGHGDDMTTKWQQHGDEVTTTSQPHDDDMTTTWKRHDGDMATMPRCRHIAATLPPHRHHVLIGRNKALWQLRQPMWRQCGGHVAANVAAMSFSRHRHVVVMSSRCHRCVVVMSSWCRRCLVVMLSPCHHNVVAMSTPPLPIRPAMDPPIPTRNLCPQAYRIYLIRY